MFKEALAFATALVTSPVAAWRVVVIMVGGGHIAWACGWLPGIQGFAMAGEVEGLENKLVAIETKQNIALRIALADEICRLHALRDQNVSNQPLWQTLNETFNNRQEDYRAVNNGVEYAISQCSAQR